MIINIKIKNIHQNYCFEQNENYLTGVLLHGIHVLYFISAGFRSSHPGVFLKKFAPTL